MEVRRDYEKHAPAWRSSEQMLSPLYGLRPKDGKHCRLHTDFSLVPPNFLLHFISPAGRGALARALTNRKCSVDEWVGIRQMLGWGTTNVLRCLSNGRFSLTDGKLASRLSTGKCRVDVRQMHFVIWLPRLK
jgi:hypothetical protein